MKHHPIAGILPAMSDKEYDDLKQSIDRNGLRRPIVMLGNQILSGRHRYRACKELNIQPTLRTYDPAKDGPLPEQFVLDEDINRRHLSVDQRAIIAAKLWQLEESPKDGQKDPSKDGPKDETAQPLANFGDSGPSSPSVIDFPGGKSTNPGGSGGTPDGTDATDGPAKTANEQDGFGGDNARKALMQKLNIGHGKLDLARWVQKRDPDLLEDVAAGKLTLEEAKTKIELRASASPYRKEAADMLAADLGDEMAEQIRCCEILTPDRQLKAFVACPTDKRKAVLDYTKSHGLTATEAIKWVTAAWTRSDRLADFLPWAQDQLAELDEVQLKIENLTITITR